MRSLRSLAKSPGFTIVALVTLALGIGVNTSMFSLVQALLFRTAPFPEAERIVQINGTNHRGNITAFSEPELREIRAHTNSFESLTAFSRTSYAIAQPDRPAEWLNSINISPDMAATFRVQPLLGRSFTPEEGEQGRNQVVLLSHAFWQTRYGSDPGVLGRTLRLNGESVTVIGVMPPEFDYPLLWRNAVLWRPLNFTPDQQLYRAYRIFSIVGRLKPGVNETQAAAQLAPLAIQQEKDHPREYSNLRYESAPLQEALMDEFGRKISWMLLGLSGFVLLIACANLANLQLARVTDRLRDLAVRTALGASRARLVREQLTESVVLALAGGTLGIVLALWINHTLERNFLYDGTRWLSLPVDLTVLTLTVALSVVTGVLFGLVPAWLASRSDVNTALKQQGRSSSASRSHRRLRHALIIGEVALALVLLAGAGILQRGFSQLLQRNSGWDTDKVLTATLPLPEARFDTEAKRTEFHRRVEARLTTLPRVEHAALATSLPLWTYTNSQPVLAEGQPEGDPGTRPNAFHVMITPRYFDAMGIPVLSGRPFTPDLKRDVIIINASLARHFWPNENAVGKRIGAPSDGRMVWREVIGVVGDVDPVANFGHPETRFHVYRPLTQEPWAWAYLVVRSQQPASVSETLRRAVAEIDPDVPADQVATIRQFVDRSHHNLVLIGHILTGFALLGLLLAGVGLYGVVSHLVAQRTSEFGIRLALGATPGNVLQLVLGQGVRLAVTGLALGLAGAYALGRLLGSIMPRLASPDAIAIGTVGLLLLAVALVACWLPARRATKVNPISALRAE